MIILICLSVSLKTLGWVGDKIGHKNFLLIGMSYLTLTFMLVGVLQIVGVSQHWVYVMLYAMVGIASCTGWPSCLSVTKRVIADRVGLLPTQGKRLQTMHLEWMQSVRGFRRVGAGLLSGGDV